MRKLPYFASCVASVAFVCLSAAAQQSRIDQFVDALPKVKTLDQAAISPDGTRVAYIQSGALRVIAASPDTKSKTISPSGDLEARDAAWSPDGKRLAYIANKPHSQASQIWVLDTRNGKAKQLTNATGYMSDPRWSPDGSKLAFLFIENANRIAGPLEPMTPDAGVVEQHIEEQRVAVVDPGGGAVKQVSPADLYVYEYDWSPDGKNWAAIAAHGSGDNNWWIARLYNISADSGALRQVYKPRLQIAIPRYSPDGQNIAFIEGLMSDAGSVGGDVFVVPAAGGEAKNVTPDIKSSPATLEWASPTRIVVTGNQDGDAFVAAVNPSGGEVETLWHGFESVSSDGFGQGISLAKDGKTAAAIRQDLRTPAEVWAGPIGQWKQLTNINAGVKPIWGDAKNVHWTNDGLQIQGWLVAPAKIEAGKRYPLIITVHGGPSAACTPRWLTNENAVLPAAGYFLLCPNPRGSYGVGEAFTQGNVKDFGGGDYRDIVASIDALSQQFPIDPDRVGIKGHSYGGYMTMWAETQTNRFKAAVAGAGLSDWLSYYGENDIDQWMLPFFGSSVYDNPTVYEKSSPIAFVKNVKTPTLIVVGDRDGEVPAPQSYEWYHALKTLGVPVQFVVYPNEGHRFWQPEHIRDHMIRIVEWFDRYMGPEGNNVRTAEKK
jgi:dipeptidyl aminopeptidase/acylaminoacyl peptidase